LLRALSPPMHGRASFCCVGGFVPATGTGISIGRSVLKTTGFIFHSNHSTSTFSLIMSESNTVQLVPVPLPDLDIESQESCKAYMQAILTKMSKNSGSDLFVSNDFKPTMKAFGGMQALDERLFDGNTTAALAHAIMNERQQEEFKRDMECNFAIALSGVSRFRVNVFRQQGCVGMVIRTIPDQIPNFDAMGLPPQLKDVIMTKRGLVLLVGGTGSGKSTTLAAMIDHRNSTAPGHIITVEDPVEFVHKNKKCLVTHREVGVDTHGWHEALKNTLRQAPDVILIGEIRDTETMEHAIAFAETGHLCLGTLHANNSNQALDRIINFFPEERRQQLLMDLSGNLRGIVSQRLIRTKEGKRKAAIEIMLNSSTVADAILKGNMSDLKGIMTKSRENGMQTFDQALFDLFENGHISQDEAIKNADSQNELRLEIKLKSKRADKVGGSTGASASLSLMADTVPEAAA
jgi:twitching motility protein PilU